MLKNYIQSGKKGVMFAKALDKSLKTRFPDALYLHSKHYSLEMIIDRRYKTVILEDAEKK